MKVLIIDAQGGGLGKQLVGAIKSNFPALTVIAVGANTTATAAMLKAGADQAATGENPVLVACRSADVILGPIGIVIADALMGEITPAMAAAVGQSQARKILIPFNQCQTYIAGVGDLSAGKLIASAVELLRSMVE